MLVRRDEFRASKIMVGRVKKTENIEILFNTNTVEVLGDGQGVTGAKVTYLKSGSTLTKQVILLENQALQKQMCRAYSFLAMHPIRSIVKQLQLQELGAWPLWMQSDT